MPRDFRTPQEVIEASQWMIDMLKAAIGNGVVELRKGDINKAMLLHRESVKPDKAAVVIFGRPMTLNDHIDAARPKRAR